jgi:23S rRNA pseudouridine1911/1915/1917 synthase
MISEKAPEILWEDEWLLAVDKPAGLVVHPTYKNASRTLLDALHARGDGATRLFLLGRLDRLTSGIVLVAKSREIYAAVQRNWQQAEKEYLAVVEGRVESARGDISLPLGSSGPTARRASRGSSAWPRMGTGRCCAAAR